jgi:ankyrin repeat protein
VSRSVLSRSSSAPSHTTTPQPNPNQQADYLRTAADDGDLEWAKRLLAGGAPAEPADTDDGAAAATSTQQPRHSPLFLAARAGHCDLVVLLASHGADPARCGPDGTPLMAACASNSAECVSALLSAAAATAALSAAAAVGPSSPSAAASAAKAALALAKHPRTGETALHVAARSGAADAARALLDGACGSSAGGLLLLQGSGGSGAFLAAAALDQEHDEAATTPMPTTPATPTTPTTKSSSSATRSALCWARDARGRTPAVAAGAAPCGAASIEVMALLLAGCSLASAGGAVAGAAGVSGNSNHTTTLTTSCSASSYSPPPCRRPCSSSSSSAVAAAAPQDADTTALHLAAARGNGPLCSALLAACGARCASRADARGALPLHLAARCGRLEAAAILARAMGRAAVRSARDARTGATPLHEAAKSLLAGGGGGGGGGGGNGANNNNSNINMKNAMARLLIDAGCDPCARDGDGKLASEYDAEVMPPFELEKRTGGGLVVEAVASAAGVAATGTTRAAGKDSLGGAAADDDERERRATMAATAAMARAIAKEQDLEAQQVAAARRRAAEAAAAARATAVAAEEAAREASPAPVASARAIIVIKSTKSALPAKEEDAAEERQSGGAWRIEAREAQV